MSTKVALILGSLRRPGNGIGIASWLTPILRQGFSNSQMLSGDHSVPGRDFEVVFVDPAKPPLPLGPIVDGSHVPADIRDPSNHPNPSVRVWAEFVASCSGLVVLSPEYNGSYPGELKNTFDHLYWEWRRKPVMLVTYGGSGGPRCAAQLRTLLGDRFRMQIAERGVGIKLPKDVGNVPTDGDIPGWLQAYEPQVLEGVKELKELIAKTEPQRQGDPADRASNAIVYTQ